ncbi:MAG: hypothetical protein QM696_08290 [Steroidobacteraceae bacterium]
MLNSRHLLILTGLSACAAPLGAAEGRPARELLQPPKQAVASPITDRFALRGTYFQPSVDMPLRYDASPLLQGTPISGEDTLGFDGELNQGTVELTFRMTDRHRIRADFYQMNRSGDVMLDQTVRFGDDVYRVSDRVVSSMKLRMLNLAYSWSLLRREAVEIGVGLGVHLLQAEGRAAVPARLLHEDFSVAGPFATLGADATWRFTPRFSATAWAQYLPGNIVRVRNVEGSFLRYHADVQFRWRPNLAVGLGYTQQSLHVDSTDDSFAGRFELKTRGPEAFVRVSF